MKVYFDASVLVASCLADHVHFQQASAAVDGIKAGVTGYISVHGLAEFYAVSTRLPYRPPVLPNEAWQFLIDDILPTLEVVTLSSEEYQEAIHHCSQNGWGGGRVYDMLHISSARKAGCDRIYTLNVKHFQQLAPELRDLITSP